MAHIGRLLVLCVVLQALLLQCSAFNAPAPSSAAAPSTRRWPLRTPKAAAKLKTPVAKQSKKPLKRPKAAAVQPDASLASLPALKESALANAIVQKNFEVTLDDVMDITGASKEQAEGQLVSLAIRTNAQIQNGKGGKILFSFPTSFRRMLASQRLKNLGSLALQPIVSACNAIGNVTMPVVVSAWLAAKFTVSAMLLPTPAGLTQRPADDIKRNWEQCVRHAAEHAKLHANLSAEDVDAWESDFERNFHAISRAVYFDPKTRKYFDMLKGRFYNSPPALAYQRFYNERLVAQPQIPASDRGTGSFAARATQAELGTFEAIMSYLFGDQQPAGVAFSDAQLRAVIRVIQENRGVVAAEQLAPYLNPPPLSQFLEGAADARFMLPILQQLDGTPVLSKGGDLLFKFPDLPAESSPGAASDFRQFSVASRDQLHAVTQGDALAVLQRAGISVTADSVLDKNTVFEKLVALYRSQINPQGGETPVPAMLYEQTMHFSSAPERQQRRLARWGVASLFASAVAGINLARSMILKRTGKADQLMKATFPAMILSSVAFNVIPAVRSRLLQRANAAIASRNKLREEWADYLATPDAALKKKLANARQLVAKPKTKQPNKELEVEVRSDLTPVPKDVWEGRLRDPATKAQFPL